MGDFIAPLICVACVICMLVLGWFWWLNRCYSDKDQLVKIDDLEHKIKVLQAKIDDLYNRLSRLQENLKKAVT